MNTKNGCFTCVGNRSRYIRIRVCRDCYSKRNTEFTVDIKLYCMVIVLIDRFRSVQSSRYSDSRVLMGMHSPPTPSIVEQSARRNQMKIRSNLVGILRNELLRAKFSPNQSRNMHA